MKNSIFFKLNYPFLFKFIKLKFIGFIFKVIKFIIFFTHLIVIYSIKQFINFILILFINFLYLMTKLISNFILKYIFLKLLIDSNQYYVKFHL